MNSILVPPVAAHLPSAIDLSAASAVGLSIVPKGMRQGGGASEGTCPTAITLGNAAEQPSRDPVCNLSDQFEFAFGRIGGRVSNRNLNRNVLSGSVLDVESPAAFHSKSFQHFASRNSNVQQKGSEMSDNSSENSEMSSVEFASTALRQQVAPLGSGANVKDRIRVAARLLGWPYSRARDVWYADPRISINADEMRKIEEVSGIRYGREEVRDIEDIIARADALLDGADPDFHGPFVAAMRSFFRAVGGARTEG